MATDDLTRVLDKAEVPYELLPHERTESALAEAHALHHLEDDLAQQLERTARRCERGGEVVVRFRLGELRRLGG